MSEKKPVYREDNRSLKRGITSPPFLFALQMIFLLSIATFNGVSFGYNTKKLSSTQVNKYDFETTKINSELFIETSLHLLLIGSPEGGYSQTIEEQLSRLCKRKRVTLDCPMAQMYADEMFKYGANEDLESQLNALIAYNFLAQMLANEMHLLATQQVESASRAPIGLKCFSDQVLQLYIRNSLLDYYVFPDWKPEEFQLYSGFQYSPDSFPKCHAFFPPLSSYNFSAVIEGSPYLDPSPTLTPNYIESPMDRDIINQSFTNIEVQLFDVEKVVGDHWKRKEKELILFTILTLANTLIAIVFMSVAPFFYTRNVEVQRTSVLDQYRVLEGKLKLLKVHTNSIVGLKEEPRMYRLLEGSFLVKLIGYIRRVRPYLPQTAFGDIESALVTNSEFGMHGNNMSHVANVGGSVDALDDDLSMQELRTDTGLQVAYGTVVCVSSDGTESPWDEDDDDGLQANECAEKSRFIAMVDRIVNIHHGAIHSITHRYFILVWNVNNSCPQHESSALKAALDISIELGKECKNLSITISSSYLVAGTIEQSIQRAVVVCGPAMICCEKLHAFNGYNKTTIMVDKQVASKVFSLTFYGADYCAVPVGLYQLDNSARDYQMTYGLYPCRLTEAMKGWTAMFKDFPELIESQRFDEMRVALDEYVKTFPPSEEAVSLSTTIEFWSGIIYLLQKRAEKASGTVKSEH